MCTVSWTLSEGGFELFCNRDETRRRAVALPPRAAKANGVTYLAPRDGEAGGTWISVNELGLALCLVNRYPDGMDGELTSRGLLVRELAGAAAAADAEERLWRLESGAGPRYRPFTFLALEPDAAPVVWAWDGERLAPPSTDPAVPPLSSSSWDPPGAAAARRRLWESWFGGREPAADDLLEFHRSHLPERGPLSPCMHREDARTVSLTRVRVTPNAVDLAYADGPPCRVELSSPVALARAGGPG